MPKLPTLTELVNESEVQEAIERVRDGSVDDYRTIVAAYHQRLRAALAGLCPPSVEANEIAHLAFLEAYRNLARFKPGTNFFAWLCAIARYRLLAECKRVERQSRNQQNYLDQLLTERLIALAEERTELTDARLHLLEECVGELRPDARAVLDQRYQQRSPVESIARVLGRTATAVRVQLFALRKRLRDCVDRKSQALATTEH
jgi:RNA polymerase sigma-70 factor (ECF subfamily)